MDHRPGRAAATARARAAPTRGRLRLRHGASPRGFARWVGGPRPANLRSRELYWQAWLPLVLVAAFGFGLMILFAYRAVQVAPYLGSTTVALLAVTGLIPVGSFLVYLGNRASLPVVTFGPDLGGDQHLRG